MDGVDLWKAIVSGKTVERTPMVLGTRDVACLAPPWKLVMPGRGEAPLLFDIVADPNELTDVAAAHPDVIERLQLVVQNTGRVPGGRGNPEGRRGDGRGGDERRGNGRGGDGRGRNGRRPAEPAERQADSNPDQSRGARSRGGF